APHATFFHTYEWANVFATSYPDQFRLAARTFRWPDGEELILPALQIYSEGWGAFLTYYSNWPGVYGGFLYQQDPTAARRAEAGLSLLSARGARWSVFGSAFSDEHGAFDGWRRTSNATHIVELAKVRSDADLLHLYAAPARNKINKAGRAGFSVETAASPRD